MTTIAWDGKSLAGDRQTSIGALKVASTKIRRLADGRLIGASGRSDICRLMLDWLEHGGDRPPAQSEDWVEAIEIGADGSITSHFQDGPVLIESDFYAIGSGRAYAIAAMALGKGARKAVELAATFDPNTGLGVDVLRLNG